MNRKELSELHQAISRSLIHSPGQFLTTKDGLYPTRLFKTIKFKIDTYKLNPYYFKPCGTLIFCGSQGEGKTLSAVQYINNILKEYPKAILVSNTRIKGRPFNAYIYHCMKADTEWQSMYNEVKDERRETFYNEVIESLTEEFYDIKYPTTTVEDYVNLNISAYAFNETDDFLEFRQSEEWQLRDVFTDNRITPQSIVDGTFENVTVQYWGLDTLKYVNNEKQGVIFFIDEIHLELNSLESKNVPVEVMVEISQQRKQRKHIIGTSQRYNRMGKPLREQIRDIVSCKCYFGVLQYNKWIDGDSTHEVNGELAYDLRGRKLFLHSPEQYKAYDTYAKMRRYNNEWQGRPQVINLGSVQNE